LNKLFIVSNPKSTTALNATPTTAPTTTPAAIVPQAGIVLHTLYRDFHLIL